MTGYLYLYVDSVMANRLVFFLLKGYSVYPKMKTSTIVALIDSYYQYL